MPLTICLADLLVDPLNALPVLLYGRIDARGLAKLTRSTADPLSKSRNASADLAKRAINGDICHVSSRSSPNDTCKTEPQAAISSWKSAEQRMSRFSRPQDWIRSLKSIVGHIFCINPNLYYTTTQAQMSTFKICYVLRRRAVTACQISPPFPVSLEHIPPCSRSMYSMIEMSQPRKGTDRSGPTVARHRLLRQSASRCVTFERMSYRTQPRQSERHPANDNCLPPAERVVFHAARTARHRLNLEITSKSRPQPYWVADGSAIKQSELTKR